MRLRVGQGYDVHAFTEGDHLVLGGVRIPFERAFKAHSDGDVLLHALCDALLGAAGLGDIGRHFPDSDPRYAGIDSRRLLREVMGLLHDDAWAVLNADLTVIAQRPRLAQWIPQMRENIAGVLECPVDAVNVKATTTERLGFEGREEGIAALAVVLIEGR